MGKATLTADRNSLQKLQTRADKLLESITASNFEDVLRSRSTILHKIDCIKDRLKRNESSCSKPVDYGISIPLSIQNKI